MKKKLLLGIISLLALSGCSKGKAYFVEDSITFDKDKASYSFSFNFQLKVESGFLEEFSYDIKITYIEGINKNTNLYYTERASERNFSARDEIYNISYYSTSYTESKIKMVDVELSNFEYKFREKSSSFPVYTTVGVGIGALSIGLLTYGCIYKKESE